MLSNIIFNWYFIFTYCSFFLSATNKVHTHSGLLDRKKKAYYFHFMDTHVQSEFSTDGRSSQCYLSEVSCRILLLKEASSNTVTKLVKAWSSNVQGQYTSCYWRNITAMKRKFLVISSKAVFIQFRNVNCRGNKTQNKNTASFIKMFKAEEPWQESQQREENIL